MIKTGTMLLVIFLAIGMWTSYPSFASSAPISIDGDGSDWEGISGGSGTGGELSGFVRAANDERYLYLSYQGNWATNVYVEVEIEIDGERVLSPYSPVLINFYPERQRGSFGLQDGWYEAIAGASGSYQTTYNEELENYEELFFEARIPLSALGYINNWSPSMRVFWNGLGRTQMDSQLFGESKPPLEEDIALEQETTIEEPDMEQERRETMQAFMEDLAEEEAALEEEPYITDEVLQLEMALLATGDYLEIDGYYSDWVGITHTDIYWNTRNIHQGAMVLQDDRIYVHLKASDTFNKMLETNAMHFYINDNISYDNKGNPSGDTSMMVAIANVGPGYTLASFLGNLKDPGIYDGLGAFEYDGWPKRYLGEAAFTVYSKKNDPGDECEFYMELAEIAAYFGVNENEIYTITAYFPRLGSQVMTVTGVSTGPIISVVLIVGLATAGVVIHRKRRKKEDH